MEMNTRCPLCGEKTVNGECPSCGYILSDRDELDNMTRMMDLEPDNYPEPQPMETEEEDIFPPKYYEERRRLEEDRQRREQINIHVDRFSQPPVQGNNNNNYAQPNANNYQYNYNANNTNGTGNFRTNINEMFVKILNSRYKIPLLFVIALLAPKIAVLFFAVVMMKLHDPRTERLARLLLILSILRFLTFWWFPW